MKLIVKQNDFSKALNIVQKAVSSRTTLPILTGILLETKEGKLYITATDLELGIKTFIDCEIIEEGSIVVNARLLSDLVRKIPSDTELNIITNESNKMEIICSNSDFNILGNSSDEFPKNSFENEGKSFSIESNSLKNLIKYTIFATSQDNMKPVLTGCLMEIKNKEITFVALDGFRLAVRKESLDIEDEFKVIIPSKTLTEIYRIIEEDMNTIDVIVSSSHISFKFENTIIISSLLEGEFLNYKDILRNDFVTETVVDTKSIRNSIERASLLAREDKNNLIIFEVNNNQIKINSTSEYGDAEETIDIEKNGEDLRIGFNSKYVLDVLKVIESEKIRMNFVGKINPCIINKYHEDDYTYLVLPVRIN